jgi:biotin carboxyl carrier protein
METYIIRVNGIEYEVEVEKKDGATASAAPAPKAQAAAPKAAAPAKKAAAGSGEPVICGTTGKVWKITSKEGDAVKSGDTILILEAMKMEIPVVAPCDGTVSSITVAEGDPVETGKAVAYIA